MLKANYEAVPPSSAASFSVRTFAEETFSAPYHHHPEYELTLIVQGTGKRYVGSNLAAYGPGDLVLLGPHVPHCWKTEPGPPGEKNAVSVVVQFTHNFLGDAFFSKAELQPVAHLLQRSANGLHFLGGTQARLQPRLLEIGQEADPLRRLLLVLGSLRQLAASAEYRVLDPNPPLGALGPAERGRFHRVMTYLVEQFREEITLAQAAGVAGLTPNAFCKYFKALTRKTFLETVLDYRLQYATQQLIGTDKPVAEICYDSGFGDVSYFNKAFKARLRHSPLQYRKAFRQPLQPTYLGV